MSIATRLEKLRFITQELELTFALVCALPDDHSKRVLARRVVVRAKDFIEHARQLRKPLARAAHDVGDFHARKESYAQTFVEYFPVLRDRMGAHVQNIDLTERMELWSSVEVVKLSYFVDGSREIYADALGRLMPAGYQPYKSFPEIHDEGFQHILAQLSRAHVMDDRPRFAVDTVAGTRPQDLMILNESPAHVRAKQLVSLADWINLEHELLGVVANWPNAERILKAQAVTDVVSMADCMVTRSVASGAKQELQGLEDLLRAVDEDPTDIVAFRKAFRFDAILTTLRAVRDRIGGHVDEDPATILSDLIAQIDGLDPLETRRFSDKLRAIFHATCRRIFWLGTYLTHNRRIGGVLSADGPREYVKPFDDRKPRRESSRLAITDYSESVIEVQLASWLAQEGDRDDVGSYFWNAFLHSPVVERGTRGPMAFELKVAHRAMIRRFLEGTPEERLSLFRLVLSCKNGFPKELIEIIVRLREGLHRQGDHTSDRQFYAALGLLTCNEDEPTATILREGCDAADEQVAAEAVSALYIFRARRMSGPVIAAPLQRHILSPELIGRIQLMPQVMGFLVLLKAASAYTDGTTDVGQDLVEEYAALQTAVQDAAKRLVRPDQESALLTFVSHHDYVSLAVLSADELNAAGRANDSRILVDAVIDGDIRMTHNFDVRATAQVNRALALLRAGQHADARLAAYDATRTYPSNVDLKITCIKILRLAGVSRQACAEMLAYIGRCYNLSSDEQRAFDDLQTKLTIDNHALVT